MFDRVKQIAKNASNINGNALIEKILQQPGIQAQIIDLNQLQLYEKGLQSDGSSTGTYTKVSVQFKIIKGERHDHVTLKDEGDFYDSMKVLPQDDNFEIYGNMVKPDSDLEERWPKALGLTKESIGEIIPEIKDRLIDSLKQEILK